MPTPRKWKSDAERFWSRVDKSAGTEGCWPYRGTDDPRGYVRIMIRRRRVGVHVFSYVLANGHLPEGKIVCHKCDNPPCVNPDHLFAGTHKDNTQDMMAKGRHVSGPSIHPERMARGDRHGQRLHPERVARGERCGAAVLNADAIRVVRRLGVARSLIPLKSRPSLKPVADGLGVSVTTLYNILSGRTWRHVPKEEAIREL